MNAGTYKVVSQYTGDPSSTDDDSDDSDVFTIAKAASETTVLGGEFDYDGNAHGATGSAVTGAGGLSTTATSFTYYDANNNQLPGAPVNAGTYTVIAHYAGDDNHEGSSSEPAIIKIRQATLTGVATTQAALNIAKNGELAWTIAIDQSSIVDGASVFELLNGAAFTLTIDDAAYGLIAQATVVNGTVYVTWTMDAALKAALTDEITIGTNTSASTAVVTKLVVSATTNGGNYTFADDFWTKLFYSLKK